MSDNLSWSSGIWVCAFVCVCSVMSNSLHWSSGMCVCVCVCECSVVSICVNVQLCPTLCTEAVAYGCVCAHAHAQLCPTFCTRAGAYRFVCVCVRTHIHSVVSDSLWWNSGILVCACVCSVMSDSAPGSGVWVCVWGWVGGCAQSCLTLGARAVAYGCVCVCAHTCVLSYVRLFVQEQWQMGLCMCVCVYGISHV